MRLPPPPAEAQAPSRSPRGAALQSTADLEAIRDELVARLEELDARRAVVVEQLEQLGVEPAPAASRATRPASPGPGSGGWAPDRGSGRGAAERARDLVDRARPGQHVVGREGAL